MKVEVQSKKLIAPSSPTPNHLRDYKISLMDQFNGNYTAFTLYYLQEPSEKGLETCEIRNKQLQKSLAETLTLFYPFAGRYNNEKLMVECNDIGVEYIEAKVSGKQLSEVVKGEVEAQVLNQFSPLRFGRDKTASGDDFFYANIIESATTPLVVVQANMFDCGGLAISLCISHRIADAFTQASFVEKWARVSRVGIDQVDAPKFLFPALLPARDSLQSVMAPLSNKSLVTKRVVFDGARIAGLKKDLTTTRVKLVKALIWKAHIRLNQGKHGILKPSRIINVMNLRGKVKLAVDDSCGNFCKNVVAKYVPDDHRNKVELVDLVGLLDDAFRKSIEDCGAEETEDSVLKAINTQVDLSGEICKDDIYICSSWCRFPFYEADFGWGKPVWVSSVVPPLEAAILIDSRDGNGIEAWFNLEQNDILVFLQDPDIAAFTSPTLN